MAALCACARRSAVLKSFPSTEARPDVPHQQRSLYLGIACTLRLSAVAVRLAFSADSRWLIADSWAASASVSSRCCCAALRSRWMSCRAQLAQGGTDGGESVHWSRGTSGTSGGSSCGTRAGHAWRVACQHACDGSAGCVDAVKKAGWLPGRPPTPARCSNHGSGEASTTRAGDGSGGGPHLQLAAQLRLLLAQLLHIGVASVLQGTVHLQHHCASNCCSQGGGRQATAGAVTGCRGLQGVLARAAAGSAWPRDSPTRNSIAAGLSACPAAQARVVF